MKLILSVFVLVQLWHSQALRPPNELPKKWDPLAGTILVNVPPRPEVDQRFRRDVSAEADAEEGVQGLNRIVRSLQPHRYPNPDKRPDVLINRPTIPKDFGVNRFIREVDQEEQLPELDAIQPENEDELNRQRRWAQNNGRPGDSGTWDVTVNKDKGRGPQVRTEAQGNVYTSPNGNWRVDAGGHHEFGKGRKPDYGGQVRVEGRFRRDAEEEEEDEDVRVRRWAPNNGGNNPSAGQQNDRGSWGVSVNKDKGSGPQVRTEAQGNVYKSPNGNVRVDAGGHHEFGKGRKPDYGGRVKVGGRWRREVEEEEEELSRVRRQSDKRGQVSVSVNKDRGSGPQVRTDASYRAWQSRNGNWQLNGNGFHEMGHGRKPSYGVGATLTGRF